MAAFFFRHVRKGRLGNIESLRQKRRGEGEHYARNFSGRCSYARDFIQFKIYHLKVGWEVPRSDLYLKVGWEFRELAYT